MVTRRSVLVAAAVGATVAGCTRDPQPAGRGLLLRNVSVFDGEQMLDADSVRVENGLITDVGRGLTAAGAEVHDGAGGTLLPGLIDAHAHVDARTHEGDQATADAVRFGVTTMLDMHTIRPQWLADAEEARAGTATKVADVWSAGIGVTAPGSWPDVDRIRLVPTLAAGDDAAAFVAARIAEGSDYIKVFLNEGGLTGDQVHTAQRHIWRPAHRGHTSMPLSHVRPLMPRTPENPYTPTERRQPEQHPSCPSIHPAQQAKGARRQASGNRHRCPAQGP